ncbi:bidirectional [NiFe] hydrogenase diaphorase subunit [Myxococcaceae bacterium]|nr:bidirectional [NiFe] hydrogenase diaphorase subunit [Myxococcaceae bacterium]
MTPEELRSRAAQVRSREAAYAESFRVCTAESCLSLGSRALLHAIEGELESRELAERCRVKPVGCLGLCAQGPLVAAELRRGHGAEERSHLLRTVRAEHAAALVDGLDGSFDPGLELPVDLPFFEKQLRIATENCGRIDPHELDDAIGAGAYEALLQALYEKTPADVLAEVERSGLRGRGGAGYPTGLKWRTVAKNTATPRYVVCNADEGDPGAFMDRGVLESDPHRVLEGMAIAAYAVGASAGYIYIRAEYTLAEQRLRRAISQAEGAGLLGKAIGATPFEFNVELRLGAGAYVCGEETALLTSIEGNRGQPRPRPPYPAEEGLFGKPTLINNVETFANVPPIVRRGGDWFASIGTGKSKGTKVFALAGKITNTGLVEVPMGTPLREIVFGLGGGIPDGAAFKAVQTGGPSGGCIPAAYLDSPVDYETLASLGSIMGSGGMVVMDEHTCMVDVAKFFLAFCRDESCGKCVPCRVGTVELHGLLERFSRGEAGVHDLSLLEELCDLVKSASLCGLGQSAPNPILSTLRHFGDEYRAHLEGRCPAGVCTMRREGSS